MLFPNARAGHEIVPGMGYAPGARNFFRGYKGGALGAVSSTEEQSALDSGFQQSDIDLLSSLGATDSDIQALIDGNVSLQELYAEFGVTIQSSSAVDVPGAPAGPSSTGSATAPWSAPGSTLTYQVRWNVGIGDLTVSTNSAASEFGNLLQQHQMSLVSYTQGGAGLTTYQLNCTILDSIGHQQQQDVINTLNALMQQIVGNNLAGSSVSVAVPGASSSASSSSSGGGVLASLSNLFSGSPSSTPSTSMMQWFENNPIAGVALPVVIAVGLIALLRRRK